MPGYVLRGSHQGTVSAATNANCGLRADSRVVLEAAGEDVEGHRARVLIEHRLLRLAVLHAHLQEYTQGHVNRGVIACTERGIRTRKMDEERSKLLGNSRLNTLRASSDLVPVT